MSNEKYLKTEIKTHDTSLHDNENPEQGSHCVCFLVISTDFVFKMSKNYYSQVFLGKCKYVVQKNMMSKFVNTELEISPDKYNQKIFMYLKWF